jgi:hypothetical protein
MGAAEVTVAAATKKHAEKIVAKRMSGRIRKRRIEIEIGRG